MAVNLEIERKFILKKIPNFSVKTMDKKWGCYSITQFYYPYQEGKWARYRLKSFDNGKNEYYKTIKKKLSLGVFEEDEKKITKKLFTTLWSDDKPKRLIEKTRFWYKENGLIWEIDLYKGFFLVTLEVELKNIKQKIKIPKIIKKHIIAEVTGIKEFSNFSLSEKCKKKSDE